MKRKTETEKLKTETEKLKTGNVCQIARSSIWRMLNVPLGIVSTVHTLVIHRTVGWPGVGFLEQSI